ncbi:MAG: glycosyltransferase, partial [Candidatus Eremiobacteraeota bacterium]|nr:glycosyltransferase [Candidatus Eremiobacteraeota bacterium]
QVGNRKSFAEKWASALRSHEPPDVKNVAVAARRWRLRPRVLFIDAFIPFYDRDAGSLRLATIMSLVRQLGCDVFFYPGDGIAHEPYATALRGQGIEILCRTRRRDARDILADRLPLVDVAWICRPELAEKYQSLLRTGNRRVYYDTVDLHFVRLQREAAVTGRNTAWQSMRQRELQLAKMADGTIVSSPEEAAILEAEDVPNIHVIPPVHARIERAQPWSDRRGFVFVGNFVHSPNVDAAIYLAKEVFPMIAERVPGARLTLVGNEPPPSVRALRSELVDVSGYVEDLEPFMQRARVFIAPIRFGAGIKGKIVQSMAYGVPVVTTPIGAEGIGLTHGVDAMIAESAAALADFGVSLHEDETQWQKFSTAAGERIAAFAPAAISAKLKTLLQPSQALTSNYANTPMSKVCATKE